MPQIAAAAAGSVVVGAITGATVATIAQSVVASVALGALSSALAGKPKVPNTRPTSSTITSRQPAATRKYVYGQTRISDVFAHIASDGNKNKFLHMFVILCNHEVEEIGEVWADDYCIPPDWLDEEGNVTEGRFAEKMRIRKHLGSETQAADAFAVNEIDGWTTNHRLRGIAYLYVRLQFDSNKYPSGEPNFSAIVKGKKIYDPRTSTTSFSTNLVLQCRDYLTGSHGFATSSVDDDDISSESSIADEIVDTASKDMQVASIDTATDIITLDGDALLYEIGDRCELLTTGVAPSGLATSTSYYVIPYQFKTTPRIKLAASLSDAMAGNAIDIVDSGTGTHTIRKNGEPRYHGGGIIDTGEMLETNLQSILSGTAGRATCIGGEWKILTGAWRAPVYTLSETDFRDSFTVKPKISMSDRFNSISGLYVSSINDYQQTDYPPVTNETFKTEDYDIDYPRELNLPFTNRSDAAQRVAKIELLRARQEIVISCAASMKGLLVQAGDTIGITFDRYGFSDKAFEVTNFSFDVSGDSIVTRMTLRETAEGIYTWSLSEAAEVDPAQNTTLTNPFDVSVPTGVAFSSVNAETRDGDLLYSLTLQWDEHPDSFVTNNGFFEIQYKLSSADDWLPTFSVSGDILSTVVVNSSVNVSYDIRIRAKNSLGVRSNWSTITGAVAGSSGGVGTTDNWQTFSDSVTTSLNWQTFSDTVTTTDDWGYFT